MKGNLTLVGGPGDGVVLRNVPTEVRFIAYNPTVDTWDDVLTVEQVRDMSEAPVTTYQLFSFLEGPDPNCNARFAIPERMSIFEGIARLAANYHPSK